MSTTILTPEKIIRTYDVLAAAVDSKQKRGYDFEELIHSLLHHEWLDPKSSYRPHGEQIDGSFFWQGQTFLLEAKWVRDPIPASDIYAFKGKLDGKFHTSSGIFLSASGFSDEVEDALKFGKSLNILLFDQEDIPLLFSGKVPFLDMLTYKLRAAGDTGSLRAPYKLKEAVKEIRKPATSRHPTEDGFKTTGRKSKKTPVKSDILFFVEGV